MSVKNYLDAQIDGTPSIFSRGNDFPLAFALVAIVALMVLPVPTWVLDILVAVNIVFGLLLVLMGIYITSPLQFSVFPSILLISTLYRLALSVATTRMILLDGNAGEIIDTFGKFVAGGNIVVGLVVFLIITIVQFIVIAKGSERVAEVSARFSLDAMPGKQMSIDSDLRSGLIDKEEARKKRSNLELEAKLHGSMDGAMKFVKGDAIAGIVIIIVNLLGGLAIGVLQLDMEMRDAMAKYSILTVGDGMVAQIPALLGALSAGLIVTRVTGEKSERHLGDSIQKQFGAVPRASLVAGGLCFFLALVPGFPSFIFVLIGVALMLASLVMFPNLPLLFQRFREPNFASVIKKKELAVPQLKSIDTTQIIPTVPLLMQLSQEWSLNNQGEKLSSTIANVQQDLHHDLGLMLPKMNFHIDKAGTNSWQLLAHEVPIAQSKSKDDQDMEQIAQTVHRSLRRNARLFLGLQETSTLLNQISVTHPDIVKEALRILPLQSLAAILRNLVEESVSIRNLQAILEAVVDAGQSEKDINNLTEHVRVALSRQTCYRIAPTGALRVLVLSQDLEEFLSNSIRVGSGKIQLSIDPKEGERLVALLAQTIDQYKPDAVLVNVQLRKCVRMLVEIPNFDMPVLSHNELAAHLKPEVVGQIGVPNQEFLESA